MKRFVMPLCKDEKGSGIDRTFIRNCPVCESVPRALLYKQFFANIAKVSFLEGYDVVVCNNCGFAFADNIPLQDTFDLYYERQSKYERPSSQICPSRIDVLENGLKFIYGFLTDKSKKILEIGCGSGDFLRYLKEKGFINLTALEPSRKSVNFLIRECGIKAIVGTVSKPVLEEMYDMVLLLTVLEHIVDLKGAIDNISHRLRKDGLLFIRVPNACQFSDFDDSPFQQFSSEHINYFSIMSARNLLGKHGFSLSGYEEVPLRESSTTVLPMINMMFRKTDEDITGIPKKDTITLTQLKKYIELSTLNDLKINKKINAFVVSQEPIVVWGVGMHTLRLLKLGSLRKCNIVAFIDSNEHYTGSFYQDIPIHSPKELVKYANKILISSKVFQKEISDFIKNELKAPNELVLMY